MASVVVDSAVTADVTCGTRGSTFDVETIIEVNLDMADEVHTVESVDGGPICTLPGT